MQEPLVSVVMPAYNTTSHGFFDRAIKSVLNQTFQDWELIIVDDGSTDDTELVCKKYLYDGRVRYVRQNNAGMAAARNNAVKSAFGSIIAFLDHDDEWLPDKLRICLDALKANPNASMAYHDMDYGDMVFTCAEPAIKNVILDSPACISSVVVTRDVIGKVGGFREDCDFCADWDLWIATTNCTTSHLFIITVIEQLIFWRFSSESPFGTSCIHSARPRCSLC